MSEGMREDKYARQARISILYAGIVQRLEFQLYK
jgi:hypothetical protein